MPNKHFSEYYKELYHNSTLFEDKEFLKEGLISVLHNMQVELPNEIIYEILNNKNYERNDYLEMFKKNDDKIAQYLRDNDLI